MRNNPWVAGLLSLIFLGLGHVCAGKRALGAALMLAFIIIGNAGKRALGAALMLAFIVIGNLNALWLSAYAVTSADSGFFSLTLPRLLHDIFAFYGIAFWIWAIVDSSRLARYAGQTNI